MKRMRRLILFLSPIADIYILSKSETEISDSYSLLMENLLNVSAALNGLEMMNKSGGGAVVGSVGGGPGGGASGAPLRPPSSTGLVAAITVTPETSPSASARPFSVVMSGSGGGGGSGGGLRDTVDIITTL